MKWNGRDYRPVVPQKIKFKEEFNAEEYIQSLAEKSHKVPVWRAIPNPIAVNTSATSGPQPTPSQTPSNTPTPSVTPPPTGTPTQTPTQTQTGTPTNTPTQTGTPTSTPTPSATSTVFSPASISNLQHWYMSNSGATISSWTNYGLLGGSINQSTGSLQPTLRTTTLGSYSGQSVLIESQDFMLGTFASTNFSAATTFVIYKQPQESFSRSMVFINGSYYLHNYLNLYETFKNPSKIQVSLANSNAMNNKPLLHVSSGTTGVIYDAAWYLTTGTTITGTKSAIGGTSTSTSFQVGNDEGVSTSGSCDIFEILQYNKILTGTELTNVVNYLKTKYQFSTW